jgi:uncharacterized SAM-binding protein YcdF (DUF218 family)
MFFVLSKVLGFVVVPSNVILGIGIAGMLLLLTRFRRAGVRMMVVSLLLLLVIGITPIGMALISALENRFPPGKDGGPPIAGIIVLGGPINTRMSAARGLLSISGEVERLLEGANLAKRHPSARLVFTGGNPSLFGADPPEAVYAVQLFEQLGVPRDRIVLEEKSRNTAENAEFTRRLVDPKPGERWLLVTSAMHMPRSVGAFRQAGFPVEAYPVDWHTLPDQNLFGLSRDLLGGIGALNWAAHEIIGMIAYWATGRSSGLFPGPLPEASDCCAKPRS